MINIDGRKLILKGSTGSDPEGRKLLELHGKQNVTWLMLPDKSGVTTDSTLPAKLYGTNGAEPGPGHGTFVGVVLVC